jgi:hypothetical protein
VYEADTVEPNYMDVISWLRDRLLWQSILQKAVSKRGGLSGSARSFHRSRKSKKLLKLQLIFEIMTALTRIPSPPIQVIGCSMNRGRFLRPVFPLVPDIQKPIQMSRIPEDPTSRLLEYYGQYVTAKRQKEAKMIWLSAVRCRRELQKMGDLAKEAKYCQKIFEPFVGKKQAEQIYRDLCDDSRSFPAKSD